MKEASVYSTDPFLKVRVLLDPEYVMRLFIAIDISSEVRIKLQQLQQELKEVFSGARWVRIDNIHLTLRFLGDTSKGKLSELENTLRSACVSHGEIQLEHRGLGSFPSAEYPRVLWVGLREIPEGLLELQTKMEKAVQGEGFEAVTRPFHPHLTVARIGRRHNKRLVFSKYVDRSFGETITKEVVLYRSRPYMGGVRYKALERFALRPDFDSRS